MNFPTEEDIEKEYSLENVLPNEYYYHILKKYPNIRKENLRDELLINHLPCNAPRLLIIKEFRV